MRLRSCKTWILLAEDIKSTTSQALTCDTREELTGKALYVRARKRHELVLFQEVKDTLTEQVRNDADVVLEIEAVAQMYAFVPIVLVILGQGHQNS